MNFKLMIEDNLQKIDNFFKEKSKKDVYIVYIMIVAVLGALAYPFYEPSEKEFNIVKEKVTQITAKIDADKIYLKENTEATVAKLEQDIKGLEGELITQKETNKYIKEKIETISSLIYDEVAWGKYLNSISIRAKEHNIKIINFTNTYSLSDDSSFGHVLDIALDVQGGYLDTVKFINSLEQSDLVVDVNNIDIKAQEALNTKLAISVWGITYK